ncbi:hypothetical protein KW787_00095 [Candidatus Pacearchaeota archaeon]|nr:hypothetical protein [Candidatus Pacearchaeota archaeon]
MAGEIKPEVGRVYPLYVPGREYLSSGKTQPAVYIGKHPATTHLFLRMEKPEGHVFARFSEQSEIEIYCARTNNTTLKEVWESEGEDGPCWPIGIETSRLTEYIPSREDKQFILKLMGGKAI